MRKAMLILDPPSRCQECPMAHEGSGPLDTWWCQVEKKDVGWKSPPEWCPLQPATEHSSGVYECFHCGSRSVIWDCDYDYEDFGYEGNGIVQICHCENCGALIEYRVPFDEEEEE